MPNVATIRSTTFHSSFPIHSTATLLYHETNRRHMKAIIVTTNYQALFTCRKPWFPPPSFIIPRAGKFLYRPFTITFIYLHAKKSATTSNNNKNQIEVPHSPHPCFLHLFLIKDNQIPPSSTNCLSFIYLYAESIAGCPIQKKDAYLFNLSNSHVLSFSFMHLPKAFYTTLHLLPLHVRRM